MPLAGAPTLRFRVVADRYDVPGRLRVPRSRLRAAWGTRGLDSLLLHLGREVHLPTPSALRVERAVLAARHPVHVELAVVSSWKRVRATRQNAE
jgi:hypothetical protein